MTIEISSDNPRSIRAIEIAASASGWLKCRLAGGRKAYGVPSQSIPNLFHLVDCDQCSCFDFTRRHEPCKHVLGVRLHCELAKAQQSKPKQRPVLTLVRHVDGELSWER